MKLKHEDRHVPLGWRTYFNGRWKLYGNPSWVAKVREDLMGFWDGQFQEAIFKADMRNLCGNAQWMQRAITFRKYGPR